jgi:hypothetical protein
MAMLEKLFEQIESELLTDEVKMQLSTLFEAQVNDAIEAEKTKLEEKNEKEIGEFKEGLIEQVDEYMAYIVEEMMDEKEESIEEATRVATAEQILESFKTLAGNFFVSTTAEAIQESADLDDAKKDLTDAVNRALGAEKEVVSLKKSIAITAKAQEIETDTVRENFIKLAESLEYTDAESFEEKLNVIVDTVKTPEKPAEEQIEEETEGDETVIQETIEEEEEETSDSVEQHLKFFK